MVRPKQQAKMVQKILEHGSKTIFEKRWQLLLNILINSCRLIDRILLVNISISEAVYISGSFGEKVAHPLWYDVDGFQSTNQEKI